MCPLNEKILKADSKNLSAATMFMMNLITAKFYKFYMEMNINIGEERFFTVL